MYIGVYEVVNEYLYIYIYIFAMSNALRMSSSIRVIMRDVGFVEAYFNCIVYVV